MNAIPVIAALLIAQPILPPLPDEAKNPPVKLDTYETVRARALKTEYPLVVFVGVEYRPIIYAEFVGVPASNFKEYPAKCIIVSDKDGYWRATLAATATDGQILDVVRGKAVQPAAVPFRGRRGEVQAPADDNSDPPQLAVILKGMEKYESAKNTQVTQRRVSGYIAPVSRNTLENKWLVPGHLSGVEGWSSTLYRKSGVRVRESLVYQADGDAITWGRSYDDGATFADVLRNREGKVFEIRMAQKVNGVWDRHVAYSTVDARPSGYIPVKRLSDCKQCHQQAGVAAYGGNAISGADEIFSDPLHATEYGGTVQGGSGTSLNGGGAPR